MGGIVAAGHPEIRKNVQDAPQVLDSVEKTCIGWLRGHRTQPDC